MAPYIRLAALCSAIALQAGLSSSATTTIDLFVAEAGAESASIEASVVTVIPSLSETQYVVSCPENEGPGGYGPPCDFLHGASVTINPTAMVLNVARETSEFSTMIQAPDTTLGTTLTISGTASCNIQGTTSASCTGNLTSEGVITTNPAPTSLGNSLPILAFRTISEDVDGTVEMGWHMIPVTVTAGAELLPAQTTESTQSVETSSSTGAAPKATGIGQHGQAMVAGALAFAGGVALI